MKNSDQNTTKQKAVIYSRVSTRTQDTERQNEELLKYADQNSIDVIKVFSETISGKVEAESRAEFSKMLKFIKANEINLILCHELTRLGRSAADINQTVKQLRSQGVGVYFFKEKMDTSVNNPMSNLILNILAGFAEFEKSMIVERTMSGKLKAVRDGIAPSKLILGYKKGESKKWIVDEKEARLVNLIFDEYIKRSTLQTTCQYLNFEGYKTKTGEMWTPTRLKRTLKNQKYIGEFEMNGIDIPTPQIVEREIFERANRLIDRHKGEKATKKHPNPLGNGVGYCGACGAPLHMQYSQSEPTYYCSHTFRLKASDSSTVQHISATANSIYNVLIDVIYRMNNEGFASIDGGEINELNMKINSWLDKKKDQQQRIETANEMDERALNLHLKGKMPEAVYLTKQDEAMKEKELAIKEIRFIEKKLIELYDRKEMISNPAAVTEHISSNLDALEDYCKSLRVTITELDNNSHWAQRFYKNCWLTEYNKRRHGVKAETVPFYELNGNKDVEKRGVIEDKTPSARAFMVEILAANWGAKVIYSTHRNFYAFIKQTEPDQALNDALREDSMYSKFVDEMEAEKEQLSSKYISTSGGVEYLPIRYAKYFKQMR